MTISSSLNAGVTGLNVNASRLATISDNIANSATYGYKRATADFQSLVLDQSRGAYSAGGVRVTTGRSVSQNGTLTTTNNPTDLSIAGRGMIAITSITAATAGGGEMPMSLTSTGSFRADANGILRTASGQVLLGWPADANGVVPDFPRDSATALVPVRVGANEFVGNPTSRITLDVNLPATDTQVGAPFTPRLLPIEYFGNLGESQNLEVTFTPTPPVAPATASNTWTMDVREGGSATSLADLTVEFDATRPSGGTIAAVPPAGVTPAGAYDSTTGLLTVTTPSGPLEIYIGMINDSRGLSQLSNTFAPSVSKNGSPVGILASIEVDARGMLSAVYDSGFTKTLYQIPVVDVPNANGLRPLSNQAYQVSTESGPFYLWNAGDGPVGEVLGYSREESTTDVASELTQLIQTQRAYSSNAKVIQTVDEMLQETTNIKR